MITKVFHGEYIYDLFKVNPNTSEIVDIKWDKYTNELSISVQGLNHERHEFVRKERELHEQLGLSSSQNVCLLNRMNYVAGRSEETPENCSCSVCRNQK